MRYTLGNRPPPSDVTRQVKDWVARHFEVDADGLVSVMELKCGAPDCPPVQTVMLVFRSDGEIFEARVHAPCADVTEAEIAEAVWTPRRIGASSED
jgi:hypothetical protein